MSQTIREPARWSLDKAHYLLHVHHIDDPEIAKKREQGVIILDQLLSLEQMEMTFPPNIEGTVYSYFAGTTDTDQRIILIHADPNSIADQAYRQAALGIQDNQHFR